MSTNHTGNVQPMIDNEEHTHINGIGGKKVYNIDSSGNVVNFDEIKIIDDDGNVIGSDVHNTDQYHLLVDSKDQAVTGTLGALDATVELNVHGAGSAIMLVSGTWKGKIVFEGTIDNTWVNLSIVQPLGGITPNGILNDNQNGSYRVLIIAGYTKLRARMATYTSGTATVKINASDLVASNYVWQLNQANLNATMFQSNPTYLHMTAYQAATTWSSMVTVGNTLNALVTINNSQATVAVWNTINALATVQNSQVTVTSFIGNPTGGYLAQVGPREQTPTGSVLQVQIGPGDIVSNIPVMIDFDHHQVHEGETFHYNSRATTINTDTHKFSIHVPTFDNTIRGPHVLIGADVYNGAVKTELYENSSTVSGGATVAIFNRNRNSLATPGTWIRSGVGATDGTFVYSSFAGAGSRTAAGNRATFEYVLKSNTVYRFDVIGLAAGTQYILDFDFYEDLGV